MKKKYLKTSEDVEALRNTNTKIYEGCHTNIYWKFVNGVLCKFYTNMDGFTYNTSFTVGNKSNFYIEVEDEPSEEWIGKIGFFWNDDDDVKGVDVLRSISSGKRYFERQTTCEWFNHFRPLTPEEVEKYTGYKVVKEK